MGISHERGAHRSTVDATMGQKPPVEADRHQSSTVGKEIEMPPVQPRLFDAGPPRHPHIKETLIFRYLAEHIGSETAAGRRR